MKYSAIMLLFFSFHFSYSQPSADILKRLEGNWSASGKAFNMPAEIMMGWKKSLGDKFYHLYYRMEMKASDGSVQTFEGTAYYKVTAHTELVANWFDSGGEMHPIKANVDGGSLIAVWGSPETKLGKTIYRFIDSNTVEILDFIQNKKGEWKQFNKNTVVKK